MTLSGQLNGFSLLGTRTGSTTRRAIVDVLEKVTESVKNI